MDKLNCDVIQDLLPLYVDEVCSEASKQVVVEHLVECTECSEMIEKFKKYDVSVPLQVEKNNSFQKLLAKLRLRKILLIFSCVVVTFILLIGADKLYTFLTEGAQKTISYDLITVTDLCQLSDGRIAFQTMVNDDYRVNSVGCTTGDVDPVISINRGIILRKNENEENWIERFSFKYFFWVIDSKYNKISYKDPDGTVHVIWNKGDEVPKAKESFEEKIKAGYKVFNIK